MTYWCRGKDHHKRERRKQTEKEATAKKSKKDKKKHTAEKGARSAFVSSLRPRRDGAGGGASQVATHVPTYALPLSR